MPFMKIPNLAQREVGPTGSGCDSLGFSELSAVIRCLLKKKLYLRWSEAFIKHDFPCTTKI